MKTRESGCSSSSGGGGIGSGLRAAFGSNFEAVALYRISLGVMLFVELVSRYQYMHAFYSDEGTLPLRLLLPKTDKLYKIICIHCYSGSMAYLQSVLSIQVMLAIMLILGYRTKLASIGSWILYLSLTLRNTWLNFILDRYFHYLLFYSMFLPLDGIWAVDTKRTRKKNNDTYATNSSPDNTATFVTPATIAFKLFITWLYFDAGYGKYTDPLQGWTLNPPHFLPALDTYVRHTKVARYVYGLLGPTGLRYMTPTVVYVELLCAPVALIVSFMYGKRNEARNSKFILYGVIALICMMHVGIALTMNNTVLLSLVACVAWCIFLPEGVGDDLLWWWWPLSLSRGCVVREGRSDGYRRVEVGNGNNKPILSFAKNYSLSIFIIGIMASGSIWFETMSSQCNQSMEHIWSTLLHNRWNVFVGAEEYVTWEIAPGRLMDGSIVDVWSKSDQVSWEMPGAGAPCTSTARAGRWRSYPYLAELDGEDGETLWSYLCRQWDDENGVDRGNEGKKLLRFNFFMLQADVLPNMGFSATRKRLIHSHDCLSGSNFVKESNATGGIAFASSGEL